jgi:hypothetical protein
MAGRFYRETATAVNFAEMNPEKTQFFRAMYREWI